MPPFAVLDYIIPKTTVNGHGGFGILFLFLLPINCYGNLAEAI